MKFPSGRRATALILWTLEISACRPAGFSYTLLPPTPETGTDAPVRQAIREAVKAAYLKSKRAVAVVEVPSFEVMERDIRHCHNRGGVEVCGNVGSRIVVIIDPVTMVRADSGYARVQYFVSEFTKPELAFTYLTFHAARTPSGSWTVREGGVVTTGTMM